MSVVLQADHVSVWRGESLIVDDVSVTVDAGCALQLRGSNGSGKTTLLRVLVGLSIPDEGEVLFKGKRLPKGFAEFGEELLYIGHRPGVSASLNALENLSTYATLRGSTGVSIESVLSELNLTSAQMRLPCRALSAGQQRRVALARLKLQQASLWVLDEPLAALDVHGQAWVTTQIENHLRDSGTVLLTTHQPLSLPADKLGDVFLESPES